MIHAIYVRQPLSQQEAMDMVVKTGISIIYGDTDNETLTVAFEEDEEVKVLTMEQLAEYDTNY
jgi:hypothetical protein